MISVNNEAVQPKELSNSAQRLAYIDSTSNTIKLGKGDFEDLANKLKKVDS
jgi:hypothetical protein